MMIAIVANRTHNTRHIGSKLQGLLPKKVSSEKKKRVSFNKEATSRSTISLDHYTLDEIDRTWYSEEEMYDMTEECYLQVEKMRIGETLDEEKYCSRGLEGFTLIGSILKKKSRRSSTKAVLKEQDKEWTRTGELDDEAIANKYCRTTKSSQMWAQVVGQSDHREAEIIFSEDDEELFALEEQMLNFIQSKTLTRLSPREKRRMSMNAKAA